MLNKKFLFLSIFSLGLTLAYAASFQWTSAKVLRFQRAEETQPTPLQSPKILKEQGTIVLPEKMKAAINKFNPGFKIWTLNDYSPQIAKDDSYYPKDDPFRAPFALIVDANKDGVFDVILDGHDNQKAILLGVVSNKEDYKALGIWERELVDPKTIKNIFHDPCKNEEFGLPYYMVANTKSGTRSRDGQRMVFEIHWPQQCAPNDPGRTTDGAIHGYIYKNGKFVLGYEETI